jgi:stage III sporulation protein AE
MIKIKTKANKRLHIFVIILLFTLVNVASGAVVCRAHDEGDARIDGIINDFYDAVPEGVSEDELTDSLGVKRILATVVSTLWEHSGEISSLLLTLLGVSLMSALASFSDSELSPYISSAVGIVSAALMLERLRYLVVGVADSLSEINAFFGAVIPIALAVNSLGASPTTATTQAMGMGLTLGAYSFVSERLLMGVVGALFVCSALSGLDPMLARLSQGVKKLFFSLIGIMSTLIGATFALQSTVASSTDSLAVRGAKYAVSSTIPIVGSAVSGALSLIGGGVAYARTVVGGGAIGVVLALMLAPMVTLLAYRLCLCVGITVSSWCSRGGIEGVLSSFLGAFDALIAVYALTSAVYVVELVAFLKGGVGLA